MSITRAFDVKLKVLPILGITEHLYYYEGPCRFGAGESLQPGFDGLAAAQKQKATMEILKGMECDQIEIMDMQFLKRTDNWDNKEEMWKVLKPYVDECDVMLGSATIGNDDLFVELVSRFDKPLVVAPDSYASNTEIPAAARALTDGAKHEVFSTWRWEQVPPILNAIRARKVLNETRILCATRFASPTSQSSIDSFNSWEKITAKLGIRFRFVNIHELLDQMTPAVEGGNHTTPGRETWDLTEEDMAAAEKMADALIAGASSVDVDREYILRSLYAYITVRKTMDYRDCNGFSIPCPDVCSTRRLNEMKFTFCLTHSLNMEQGIPSCCEFDVNSVACMQTLMAVSGMCPYVGNTEPLNWFEGPDGELYPLVLGMDKDQAPIIRERAGEDKKNVYFMQHSVAHRRIADPNVDSKYWLQHFAYDQGFGAVMRYNFDDDQGKKITMMRYSPDGSKMFIAQGECICGDGYNVPNCAQIIYFRVEDADDFFEKQCDFGNHLVMVYGDYKKELIDLAKLLKIEPVVVGYGEDEGKDTKPSVVKFG